jgi:hypothetical protein
MTFDQYKNELLRLKTKAESAAADQQWRIAMLAAMELAEFALDHPEFWPNQHHDRLKRGAEEIIERAEKVLGMR